MLDKANKGFLTKAKYSSFFPDMTSTISKKGLIPKNEQNKGISPFTKSLFGRISTQKRGIQAGGQREAMQLRN